MTKYIRKLSSHAFDGAMSWFTFSQIRFLATKAAEPGSSKNNSQLRAKVSKILDLDVNVQPKKRAKNISIDPKFVKGDRKSHKKNTWKKSHYSEAPFPDRHEVQKPPHTSGASNTPIEPLDYITQLIGTSRPGDEKLKQVHKPEGESIPKLAHKLDRVLFSPGVHFLQDPRTRVYNFSPYLKSIVSHEDFDFEKIQKFVSASKDETLLREAKAQDKKFYSSTSSMTSTLHQFYLFLNNYSHAGESKYRFDFPEFSKTAKDLPSAVIVEPKGTNEVSGETIYSITSDKSTDVEILLSAMGHCLEALLTTEEEEFKELLIKRGDNNIDTKTESPVIEQAPVQEASSQTSENVYNYSGYGDFLMRSQLDCYDSRLPGNGTFDLKTRAAASIRYDKASEASDSSYQIWKLNGNIESFQREFEDLIRTGGLLKYGFQARIGQMDGIFVAYHNINSFFGFQYLPLGEIDRIFFANNRFEQSVENHSPAEDVEKDDNMPTLLAESQFKASLQIWQDIMRTVEQDLKGTEYEGLPFRLVMKRVSRVRNKNKSESTSRPVKSTPKRGSFLSVFAVPMSPAEVNELQSVSSKYQTSFRENITDAERFENLERIQSELNEFNERLVERTQLLSYIVKASLYVNGAPCVGESHQYPKSSKDDIEWRYSVQRICKKHNDGDGKTDVKQSSQLSLEQYLQATQLCTNMLTKAYKESPQRKEPSLTDVLRKYSDVGKLRLEKWDNLENPPRVY